MRETKSVSGKWRHYVLQSMNNKVATPDKGYANTTGQLKCSFCSTQVAVAPRYGVRLHYRDQSNNYLSFHAGNSCSECYFHGVKCQESIVSQSFLYQEFRLYFFALDSFVAPFVEIRTGNVTYSSKSCKYRHNCYQLLVPRITLLFVNFWLLTLWWTCVYTYKSFGKYQVVQNGETVLFPSPTTQLLKSLRVGRA